MSTSRRLALAALLSLAAAGCGGTLSTLHHRGRTQGTGGAAMEVKNSSGVTIQRLFVAKTEAVSAARAKGVQPGSEADEALWGDDHLDNAGLLEGHTLPALGLPEGRYDVLVLDPDRREQLVKGLRLAAGGKYTLEIGDAWRIAR